MSDVTQTVVSTAVSTADTATGDAMSILQTAVADATELAGAPIRVGGKLVADILAEAEAARKNFMELVAQATGAVTKHLP